MKLILTQYFTQLIKSLETYKNIYNFLNLLKNKSLISNWGTTEYFKDKYSTFNKITIEFPIKLRYWSVENIHIIL